MWDPGSGSSSAPDYELQSFPLTDEEKKHFQYVVTAGDDDDDYQTQYSTKYSRILHQLHRQTASHDADADSPIRSDVYFVVGCILYLIATLWDWNIYSQRPDQQVEDLHSVLNTPQYIFYQFLWIMAPLIYLFNGFFDVKWAFLQRARDAAEKERKLQRSHIEAILNATSSPEQQEPCYEQKRQLRINAVLKRPKNLFRRMRKHVGHRRQIGAATTFGIAAGLSVIAALLGLFVTDGPSNISQDSKDMVSTWVMWLESGSIHLYLVSAVFALWRSPWKVSSTPDSGSDATRTIEPIYVNTPWYSRTDSLETIGDILFASAIMVDVFLQDSTLDDGIYWWPVVSAVLCLADSLFYIRGDFATVFSE